MYAKVAQLLIETIELIMLSSPACLVSPLIWNRYESLLRRSLVNVPRIVSDSLNRISKRNQKLQSQVSLHATTPKQRVIRLLDTAFEDVDVATLGDACLALMHDPDSLVTTYLQWGSSLYRTGSARIYLTVRLLRGCCAGRNGLDEPITRFISRSGNHVGLSKPSLFRILAELFRSKHLTVGKYLQWLIARGGTNRPLAPAQVC